MKLKNLLPEAFENFRGVVTLKPINNPSPYAQENNKIEEEKLDEASKLAFVDNKLIQERIMKSGLLPLLGQNAGTGNRERQQFIRELTSTLKKLYKQHSTLKVK